MARKKEEMNARSKTKTRGEPTTKSDGLQAKQQATINAYWSKEAIDAREKAREAESAAANAYWNKEAIDARQKAREVTAAAATASTSPVTTSSSMSPLTPVTPSELLMDSWYKRGSCDTTPTVPTTEDSTSIEAFNEHFSQQAIEARAPINMQVLNELMSPEAIAAREKTRQANQTAAAAATSTTSVTTPPRGAATDNPTTPNSVGVDISSQMDSMYKRGSCNSPAVPAVAATADTKAEQAAAAAASTTILTTPRRAATATTPTPPSSVDSKMRRQMQMLESAKRRASILVQAVGAFRELLPQNGNSPSQPPSFDNDDDGDETFNTAVTPQNDLTAAAAGAAGAASSSSVLNAIPLSPIAAPSNSSVLPSPLVLSQSSPDLLANLTELAKLSEDEIFEYLAGFNIDNIKFFIQAIEMNAAQRSSDAHVKQLALVKELLLSRKRVLEQTGATSTGRPITPTFDDDDPAESPKRTGEKTQNDATPPLSAATANDSASGDVQRISSSMTGSRLLEDTWEKKYKKLDERFKKRRELLIASHSKCRALETQNKKLTADIAHLQERERTLTQTVQTKEIECETLRTEMGIQKEKFKEELDAAARKLNATVAGLLREKKQLGDRLESQQREQEAASRSNQASSKHSSEIVERLSYELALVKNALEQSQKELRVAVEQRDASIREWEATSKDNEEKTRALELLTAQNREPKARSERAEALLRAQRAQKASSEPAGVALALSSQMAPDDERQAKRIAALETQLKEANARADLANTRADRAEEEAKITIERTNKQMAYYDRMAASQKTDRETLQSTLDQLQTYVNLVQEQRGVDENKANLDSSQDHEAQGRKEAEALLAQAPPTALTTQQSAAAATGYTTGGIISGTAVSAVQPTETTHAP